MATAGLWGDSIKAEHQPPEQAGSGTEASLVKTQNDGEMRSRREHTSFHRDAALEGRSNMMVARVATGYCGEEKGRRAPRTTKCADDGLSQLLIRCGPGGKKKFGRRLQGTA